MDIAGPNGEYASMTESTEPSTTKNDYFAKILFGVFCFGLFLMFNHAIFWPEKLPPDTRSEWNKRRDRELADELHKVRLRKLGIEEETGTSDTVIGENLAKP